jgi:glycine cleavage system aminomethyltransferase T
MPSQEISTALASGKGFTDLFSWRKVDVSGADALTWLSHLGSADVTGLAPGRAQPTVIRSQDGIEIGVTVALAGPNVLVIQDPEQPSSVLSALEDAVAGYDVAIEDRTDALSLFAFPGAQTAPDVSGTAFSSPSCLGAGVDVFALSSDHEYLLGSLQHGFMLVGLLEVRAWLADRSESGMSLPS